MFLQRGMTIKQKKRSVLYTNFEFMLNGWHEMVELKIVGG